MKEKYDLRQIGIALGKEFPLLQGLYLFGSRRYRTGSARSDVDILCATEKFIPPSDLRRFSLKHWPGLDLFLIEDGKATSCANDSRVEAKSLGDLVAKLDAIAFWDRSQGIINTADVDWTFELPIAVEFTYTTMLTEEPVGRKWFPAADRYFEAVEAGGLPIRPYLGGSATEIANFLADLLRRLITIRSHLVKKSKGITVQLINEYDMQNLFLISVKPWLPNLAREEVTVHYDGQDKSADFSLLDSQIVVEMKHVKDANTKAAVAKTLSGLATFYKRNSNVRELLFAILVEPDVDLDDHKWESDFSTVAQNVKVRTIILRRQKD